MKPSHVPIRLLYQNSRLFTGKQGWHSIDFYRRLCYIRDEDRSRYDMECYNVSENIQLFENKRIRTAWDEKNEEWLLSVVDVVGVLTDQPTQRGATLYWGKLKQRLKEEGSKLLTDCQQLKMTAADGKKRLTDVANAEQLLRIIQSIPSPKELRMRA